MPRVPDIIKQACRDLRKNMTHAEKLLWNELKSKKLDDCKFQRQLPMYVYTENNWLDRYIIPDFTCYEEKIIIELDWTIHDIPEVIDLDKTKEQLVRNLWFTVLRFENTEITNDMYQVVQKIKTNIKPKSQ